MTFVYEPTDHALAIMRWHATRHNMDPDDYIELRKTHKRCPHCGNFKPHEQFYPNADKYDGLSVHCKPCGRRLSIVRNKRRRQYRNGN